MLRCTKSAVLEALEKVIRLKKSYFSAANERITQRRKSNKSDLSVILFVSLEDLVVLCDRQVAIEPSPINIQTFIGAARALQSFFDDVISRLPSQPDWENVAVGMKFTEFSFALSNRIINPERVSLEKARRDLREHAEEQQKMRARSRRLSELIDDADLIEAEKEMSLEEAILIIQKLERVYQAISRYNYLRHVYQRAMDIREGGTTMTAEEAIIRIQARTRGYFARKHVREMRKNELDLLGMSTSALLNSMKPLPEVISDVPAIEKVTTSLESLLEELKDNFFPPAVPEEIPFRPLQRKAELEDVYHELCLRRVIRDGKRQRISMGELISDTTLVSVEKRTFELDIRLFLNCSFVIPLALRGWRLPSPKRWLLLIGPDGSGKSAWSEAVAAASGAVHLRVSPGIISKGRRRTVKSIAKYARMDPNVVISIDRLEMFKLKSKKASASLHLTRMLLSELAETNAFVIGMSRQEEIHPSVQDLFTHSVTLRALSEPKKLELIGRFLRRTQDAGRLPRIPEKISDIRRETKALNCGQTGKVVRSQWSRAAGN